MEAWRSAWLHADLKLARSRLSSVRNRTQGMKHRIRSWAVVSTALAVGLASIFLVWIGARSGASGDGESSPQLTAPPGVSSPSLHVWGAPNRSLISSAPARYLGSAEAESFLLDGDKVYLLRRGTTTFVFPEVLLTSYHVVNDVMDRRAGGDHVLPPRGKLLFLLEEGG